MVSSWLLVGNWLNGEADVLPPRMKPALVMLEI